MVSLTKETPTTEFAMQSDVGEISVNLLWSKKKKKFFGLFGKQSVDLDLGAYVKFTNGEQTIIQALGNMFGNFDEPPYIKLRNDDRTGDSEDGEWLYVNGKHLDEIEEIVIFAFIYEGIPNWTGTDGKVTIQIPGQDVVETELTEGTKGLSHCAVARICKKDGILHIQRLNEYFKSHREMDTKYGWGFKWKRGKK